MNKLEKNKQIERPKVEPLGDMRIAEARSKFRPSSKCLIPYSIATSLKILAFRFLGANEKGND